MARAISQLYPFFTDASGLALDNGYVYVGTANLNPITNPVTVYWDEALTVTAQQPLRTMGGLVYRNGTPTNFYTSVDVSIVVMDSAGELVWSLPEQPVPFLSPFGEELFAAADAEEAQEILDLVPGEDIQVFMQTASEAEMRSAGQVALRAMSPELVGDAIDELGTYVRISSDDTTPGYLADKTAAGTGIELSVTSPAGDETLVISAVGNIRLIDDEPLDGIDQYTVTLPDDCIGFDFVLRTVGTAANTIRIRLGTSGGILTTGYESSKVEFDGAGTTNGSTIGFDLSGSGSITGNLDGIIHFRRGVGTAWIAEGLFGQYGGLQCALIGRIVLGAEITQVRISCSSDFTSGNISVQAWSE